MLSNGWTVFGVSRNAPPTNLGDRFRYSSIDLSDHAQWTAFLSNFECEHKLDGIVLSAAQTGPYNDFSELPSSVYEALFKVNLYPYIEVMARLPGILKPGGALIILSSNTLTFGAGRKSLPYACSKAALETVTRVAMKSYATEPFKFRINIIRPGFIDTGLAEKTVGYSHEQKVSRIAMVPFGRAGTSVDIASMIAFLVGNECSYVSGQTISIAGGE
jgi:NAD(P)-dependent dehydrogenase (short-subunit alcohol dehydrogenase family)